MLNLFGHVLIAILYILLIVRNISITANICSFSDFGDNNRYISSYIYGIGIYV